MLTHFHPAENPTAVDIADGQDGQAVEVGAYLASGSLCGMVYTI